MRTTRIVTSIATLLACAAFASAGMVTDTQSVSFTTASDPSTPNKTLSLASFDTSLGTLTSVKVEFFSSGEIWAKVYNDDPYSTGSAQASITRQWSATGPEVSTGDNRTVYSPVANLGYGPDSYEFGVFGFTNQPAGTFTPATLTAYETAGPGSVSFLVTPIKMVNRLDWIGTPPDVWRQDLENPLMTVTAKVTYTYTPEPMTVLFLGLGSVLLARRRSA